MPGILCNRFVWLTIALGEIQIFVGHGFSRDMMSGIKEALAAGVLV
jgi:hypothetical protein